MIEIEEVKTPEMLRDFLRCKGGKHKAYYQYTNFDALEKISRTPRIDKNCALDV